MVVDHHESGSKATTRWHSCPLCRTRRMTSEPEVHMDATNLEEPESDDENAYAVEPLVLGAPHET